MPRERDWIANEGLVRERCEEVCRAKWGMEMFEDRLGGVEFSKVDYFHVSGIFSLACLLFHFRWLLKRGVELTYGVHVEIRRYMLSWHGGESYGLRYAGWRRVMRGGRAEVVFSNLACDLVGSLLAWRFVVGVRCITCSLNYSAIN